ncbi:hypothetical protein ALC62_10879 [Cyphomyrmex costatus]|uniref:Uncharacterized protein n=1 Tax=Cyphomyrmex costatus TaxID=456900 RepID=A0A151IDE0_9HYME|nr:hypothetical protein ALC62_10879 [Cyphomyrmex costatus]
MRPSVLSSKRKRARGRPWLDGTGPFRSPSLGSDASITTRVRGVSMERFRSRCVMRNSEDEGEDDRPLRSVHIPSSSFFTLGQRREVDRQIASLNRASTIEMAQMLDD